MTRPLPIGTFKRQTEVSMEILNNSITNFNPYSNVGEIFVVDIEFNAYDDPKKNYTMKFFHVFEPKCNVPVRNRGVY